MSPRSGPELSGPARSLSRPSASPQRSGSPKSCGHSVHYVLSCGDNHNTDQRVPCWPYLCRSQRCCGQFFCLPPRWSFYIAHPGEYRLGIDDGTFIISWTERNGPPVSPPKRRGFGALVMETMAARSVDGTVDLDYASSGVTWRLACRAANALSPREAGGLSWSVDQRNG
jgi:hypothetical protein